MQLGLVGWGECKETILVACCFKTMLFSINVTMPRDPVVVWSLWVGYIDSNCIDSALPQIRFYGFNCFNWLWIAFYFNCLLFCYLTVWTAQSQMWSGGEGLQKLNKQNVWSCLEPSSNNVLPPFSLSWAARAKNMIKTGSVELNLIGWEMCSSCFIF